MSAVPKHIEDAVNALLVSNGTRGPMDLTEYEELLEAIGSSRRRAKRDGLPAGACGEVVDERDLSVLACGEALLCAEPAAWEVIGMSDGNLRGSERRPVKRVCASHLHSVLGDNQLVRKVNKTEVDKPCAWCGVLKSRHALAFPNNFDHDWSDRRGS